MKVYQPFSYVSSDNKILAVHFLHLVKIKTHSPMTLFVQIIAYSTHFACFFTVYTQLRIS
jgi:hypothetical protein